MQWLADGLAKVIRYYRRRSKARQLLIHLNEWREKGKILAFRYATPVSVDGSSLQERAI